MNLWALGFLAGGVVVLIVAILLIGILLQARRIRRLAQLASDTVAEIDVNTRSVWSLSATNNVAKGLLDGSRAIDGNAATIVDTIAREDQKNSAA